MFLFHFNSPLSKWNLDGSAGTSLSALLKLLQGFQYQCLRAFLKEWPKQVDASTQSLLNALKLPLPACNMDTLSSPLRRIDGYMQKTKICIQLKTSERNETRWRCGSWNNKTKHQLLLTCQMLHEQVLPEVHVVLILDTKHFKVSFPPNMQTPNSGSLLFEAAGTGGWKAPVGMPRVLILWTRPATFPTFSLFWGCSSFGSSAVWLPSLGSFFSSYEYIYKHIHTYIHKWVTITHQAAGSKWEAFLHTTFKQ